MTIGDDAVSAVKKRLVISNGARNRAHWHRLEKEKVVIEKEVKMFKQ